METPSFSSPDEEVTYWRTKADSYMKGMLDAQEELEEYQIGSKELETELEAHIEQLEKRNRELILLTEKLTAERDKYWSHLDSGQSHLHSEVATLQEELNRYKHEKENSQKYIRQLEQENDDLERSNRTAITSIEEIENKLNQALERTAILESELDEKEALIVTVQRLKDEARDLHYELATTRRQPTNVKPSLNGSIVESDGNIAGEGNRESMVQAEASSTPRALSPPVRVAALSMVNDALQKISQLEFKLSALYHSYGTPPLSASPGNFMSSFNFGEVNGTVDLPSATGPVRLKSISRQSSAKRRQSDQFWQSKADRLVTQ